jgi:hypothetical protein
MSISTTSGGFRQVVFSLDDHAESAAQQRLVVGQQDGNVHAAPPAR